jgi:hypothetical protein
VSTDTLAIELADQDVADARAYRHRPDDDRERAERPPDPQLADAPGERLLELREAAADDDPELLVGPFSHAGRERITGQ